MRTSWWQVSWSHYWASWWRCSKAQIQRSGADFVIAQGSEAGGHRGTFSSTSEDELLPLDDLLCTLRPHISLPIVAAGGIMTSSDVRRVLQLGAEAVQIGTAFLTCHESSASLAHKKYLLSSQGSPRLSVFTRAFSGRIARGVANLFIERARQEKPFILPFPLQNTLTSPLRLKAVETNDGEVQAMWAGAGFHKCRSIAASDLLRELASEL